MFSGTRVACARFHNSLANERGGTLNGYEYCVYEDRELPAAEMNEEHIIPLALGGVDELVIRSSIRFNSHIGSRLEGALTNELAMSLRRNEFNVRGHSKKRPVPTYKAGRIKELNLPVQVQLDKCEKKLRLYSPQAGRFLENHESAGCQITFRTTIDPTVRLRFAAKVAIGAGYFAYSDKFVENARVDHLRAVVCLDKEKMSDELKVVDNLTGDISEQQKIILAIGKHVGVSSVVIMPSSKNITFVVTCLKEFCGLLRVSADTSKLPNDGHYKWGHILACDGNLLRRGSLFQGLELLRNVAAMVSQEP